MFTLLEAESEMTGICYSKPKTHSSSIIVKESKMIFTTLNAKWVL